MSSLRPFVRSAACAVAVAVSLSACGDSFHRPAVVVHGVAIDDDTVKAAMPQARVLTALVRSSCGTQSPGESSRSPCLRYTVGLLIQRQIARAYAVAHGIRVRPFEVRRTITAIEQRFGPDQVQAILRQFGVAEPQFEGLIREQLLVGKVQQAVASAAVGEARLRAEYRREHSRFTLIHIAHIQVDTEEQAKRIAAEATPANFAQLAKQFSTDQGSSSRGGDLGTLSVGQLPPEFAKAAVALQPGGISGPVEIPGFGWHVIRLISIRVSTYEDVRQQLQSQLYPPAIQAWFRGQLRDGVEVNPRYGLLDPSNGDVVPLNSTSTALPSPSPSPS